jgi:aspartyl-tRNA synthetase
MAQRTLISDLPGCTGRLVTVQGFVHVIRDQKAMQFLVLRDHTGLVQVAAERSPASSRINDRIASLTRESAVSATGTVVENPRVKLGGLEILLQDLEVASLAEPVLPIDISGRTETDLDKRLDYRFLDLRRPEAQLIFRVATTVEAAMRRFWVEQGFVEIHTPKLMGSPSESGAELFSLEYFGRTAHLAQSPQFYKQMAIAGGLDRVFEIAPAFRADPSFTSRHATEFTSVDMEMAWIDSHEDVMAMEERWLHSVLEAVRQQHGEAIRSAFGVEVRVPGLPFPRIPMAQAQEIVRREGHRPPADTKPGDLDPQGERVLCEYALRELGHEFVFVTDYPAEVRPFYHMRLAQDPGLTRSFDLLWKWLEITTGAQREHRHEILLSQAREKGLRLEPIEFYLDFFRFGCPPHGGFGFGLARLLAALLNQPNIREVTFLHRGPNRLMP